MTLSVAEGTAVQAGGTVATIEAMKMEASIAAPRAGVVHRTAISSVQQVEGGDLLGEREKPWEAAQPGRGRRASGSVLSYQAWTAWGLGPG